MDREHILSEIKRTAAENGGVPLGMDLFREATGIRRGEWEGIYWAKWTDAQVEAGFERNQFGTSALDEEWMLQKVAEYTRELGHFPVRNEMRLHKKSDPKFPNVTTLGSHFGKKAELLSKVLDFCSTNEEWQDVAEICIAAQDTLPTSEESGDIADDGDLKSGHVYLLKHGKAYRIGCSADASRRYKAIKVQMPYKTEEIHVIETDDRFGIEAYWHRRFADKRLEGEWFELSASDVKAFKKRKFQ